MKKGGTGIRPTEPGNTITLDGIRKFESSTFEAFTASMISCVATLYAAFYSITDKMYGSGSSCGTIWNKFLFVMQIRPLRCR